MKKIIVLLIAILIIGSLSVGLVACGNDNHIDELNIATGDLEGTTIRFAAPQGTPALSIAKLIIDNQMIDGAEIEYAVVDPSTIAAELSKSDLVIMPVNAGATKIVNANADFKLVSVSVEGSLYIIGNKEGNNQITIDDIKGKTIASIGQNGVPDLILKHILSKNNIQLITDENAVLTNTQVRVKYVSAAGMAKTELINGTADFALVGEPAVTQFKAALSLNAEFDLQAEYSRLNNNQDYPQAGLFVKTSLAKNTIFMEKLYKALENSEDWIENNANVVQQKLVDSGRYDSAVFPASSIARCNISNDKLDNENKDEIIAFLNNVTSKDWNLYREKLFI